MRRDVPQRQGFTEARLSPFKAELVQEGEEVIVDAEWDELKYQMLHLHAEHRMPSNALEDLCILFLDQEVERIYSQIFSAQQ